MPQESSKGASVRHAFHLFSGLVEACVSALILQTSSFQSCILAHKNFRCRTRGLGAGFWESDDVLNGMAQAATVRLPLPDMA